MSLIHLKNKKYYAVFLVVALLFIMGLLIINPSFKNNKSTIENKVLKSEEQFNTTSDTIIEKEVLNVENKILLIGIDGADKNEIDKLISLGRLPNLKKLIKSGVYGNLKSIKPLLSPLIWTSIATGRSPLEHGITDFLTIDRETGMEMPVSSNLRKVKALWNIFSDYQKEAGVVGWLVTWPSEIINGIMVSDHITYLDYNPHQDNLQLENDLVYPDNIIHQVKTKIVYPSSVSYNEFKNFFQVDENEFKVEQKNKIGKLYNATSVIASTETIKNMSTYFYSKHRPELFCVYFKGIDSFSHLFAANKYGQEDSITNPVSQFYVYQDNILGDILKLTDEQTTVFIVSDHGFKLNQNIPEGSSEIGKGNAVDWHNDNGIIIVAGNNVKAGIKIEGASIMDIAPTILYLSNLPVSEDFKGRVLTELIDDTYLEENLIKRTKSFEDENLYVNKENPIVSEKNEEIKAELKTLGYLNTGTANSYNNMGNLYMNEGKFKLAVQSFEKAVELAPDVGAYYDNLGSAYKELKLYDDAVKAHSKAIALDPNSAKAYNNLGRVFVERNEFKSALQNYNKALQLNPSLAEVYNNLGELYYKQGKIEEAISFINKAIGKSPDYSLAHYNLAVLLGEKDYHSEAIREFQKVLKIDPSFYILSNVYNGTGVAYFKLQDYKNALENFKRTLEIDPSFREIHLRLGIAEIMLGNKEEGIKHLKEELEISPANKELVDLIKKLEKEEKVNLNDN